MVYTLYYIYKVRRFWHTDIFFQEMKDEDLYFLTHLFYIFFFFYLIQFLAIPGPGCPL